FVQAEDGIRARNVTGVQACALPISTVALCAAAGLAREGQRVALVDADAGVRNLDLMLGVENRIVFDMLDVIEGEATLEQALCPRSEERRVGTEGGDYRCRWCDNYTG